MRRSSVTNEGDFNAQIAKLQATNNDYKLRISELEKHISTLMASKSMTPEQITKYLDQQHFIDELQSELRDAQHELSQLRAVFATQNSGLMASSEEDSAAQKNQMAVDISKRFAQQQKHLQEFKTKNSELEKQLAVCNAENAQLVVENCDLKKQIRNLTGDESLRGAESMRLQNTLDDVQQQLEIQKKVNEKSSKIISKLKTENADLKTANDKLHEDIERANNESRSMRQQVADMHDAHNDTRASVEQLQRDNMTAVKQIEEKQNELNLQKQEYQRAQIQIMQYKQQLSALERSATASSQKRTEYESMLQEARSNEEKLRMQLEEQKQKNIELKEEKTEVEIELADLRAANSQLSFTLQENNQRSANAEMKSEEFRNQIQNLRLELQSLRAAAQRSTVLEMSMKQKQKEMDALKKQYDQVTGYNETLTKQIQDLRNASLTEKSHIERMNREKERARMANKQLKENQSAIIADAQAAIQRMAVMCMRKYKMVQGEYTTKLDVMNVKLETLRKAIFDLKNTIQQNQISSMGFSTERMRFLRQIESHLRIIDSVTNTCARSMSLPASQVPPATDLINQPQTLQTFLRRIERLGADSQSRCHHSQAEVRSFLQRSHF